MLKERHERLRGWMIEKKVDVLMFQTKGNVSYLSGFHADPHERIIAVFLFQKEKPFLICPNMEVNQIKDVFQIGEIIGYSDTEDPWIKIENACRKRMQNIESVGLESETPWARVKKLEKHFPKTILTEADEAILSNRLVKSKEEIAHLKEAARFADMGVQFGVHALEVGVTELEVLAKIEFELKKKGIRDMSFSTTVLFGEKAGDPHGTPGNRQLKKGDAVLFDLGVIYEGYCSDITRTVFFDHVPEKSKEIYQIVHKALDLSLESSLPGNKISSVDKAARQWIKDQGYGDYFPHRIGHGLGLEVHEYPSLTDTNENELLPGMVYTIEPGIYIPNEFGVRIEDDVLITDNGHETLTKFPKEIQIVESK